MGGLVRRKKLLRLINESNIEPRQRTIKHLNHNHLKIISSLTSPQKGKNI